jgi:hypothetical protein
MCCSWPAGFVDATRNGGELIVPPGAGQHRGFLYRVFYACGSGARSGRWFLNGWFISYLTNTPCVGKTGLSQGPVIAGDAAVASRFLKRANRCCWKAGETVRADVFAMKLRTKFPAAKGISWGDVKLGRLHPDVEFVVQYIQLVKGVRHRKY